MAKFLSLLKKYNLVSIRLKNSLAYKNGLKVGDKILKINNKIINLPSIKLKTNDYLEIKLIHDQEKKLIPKKIELDIIYEDKDILIINKQKGLVVHPGAGNFKNTLANALAYKYKNNLSNINGKLRPGIIHRIDKDTSGLLVVAKNNISHSNLSKQFSEHTIKRKYKFRRNPIF